MKGFSKLQDRKVWKIDHLDLGQLSWDQSHSDLEPVLIAKWAEQKLERGGGREHKYLQMSTVTLLKLVIKISVL